MNEIYLTTDELSQRIKYDARTIRNCLKDSVLLEGIHYFRPFGGRKILFIWEAVERDMVKFSRENGFGIPMANGGSAVGKIVARKETGNLFFDFRYLGKRCREQTALPDTPTNRKKLEKILERIEAEITLGTFDYNEYFPQSGRADELSRLKAGISRLKVPQFKDFAQLWFDEKRWNGAIATPIPYASRSRNICCQRLANKRSAPSPRQTSWLSARHSAKFPGRKVRV
ncbi:DUF3596 domain-containing protein [Pseudomonas aeruginosa]|nr:DUF3596 domain-containing protein [Pseudomonas aeruginosa]MDF5859620.1 DUF3596 domain-containing protein [Pseudomonas aeruginosa]MDF5985711.1 DUF3596 domain-containing protein [Pseudomonas aeruginosa]